MPVFRVIKNENYTTMSNFHLRDRGLSLKEKGLESMLLSLPDKWKYGINGFAEICLEGRASITAVLKELEEHGYLTQKQNRMPDGTMVGVEYWILRSLSMFQTNRFLKNRVRIIRIRKNRVRKTRMRLNRIRKKRHK